MGRGRAPCCEKIGLKKGPWTPSEDMRLIAYIQKYGHGNWRALPKLAGLLRCGKSCRLRWINYLRPDIKRGNFTQEEEETIIKLHGLLGNKWSKIASRLPGRTDNEIKNVWNTHLKKRVASKGSDPAASIEPKEGSTSSILSPADSTLSSSSHGEGIRDEVVPVDPEVNLESPHEGSNATQMEDSSSDLIEIPFEPNLDFWDMLVDDHSTQSPGSQDRDSTSMVDSTSSKEPSAPTPSEDLPRPSLTPSSSFSSTTSTSNSYGSVATAQHLTSKEKEIQHHPEENTGTQNEGNIAFFWDILEEDKPGPMDASEALYDETPDAGEAKIGEVDTKQWIADLEYELQMSPINYGDHLLSLAKDAAEPQALFPASDGTLDFEFDPVVAYFQNQPLSPTVFSL